MSRRPWFVAALAVIAAFAVSSLTAVPASGAAPATSVHQSATAPQPATPTKAAVSLPAPAFAYYYLWWDTAHWHSTLGQNYPYGATPLPLPASLAANGCDPTSRYPGDIETDAPAQLFTQSAQDQISRDVSEAIAAGLTGFAVNWKGIGTTTQTPASNYLNQRLDMLVRAVDAARAAGHEFHLWLSYEASATKLTQTAIANDLSYFSQHYGSNRAFDRDNDGKPTFVWVGSYKYPTSVIAAISEQYRPHLYFVGGYQYNQWNTTVARYFDADSPYWSSQDPYNNPSSFKDLAGLASTLHAEHKRYFAPLTPGFDRQLDGSSGCVPRDSGLTLRTIYNGNLAGHPNGWLVISWNEITEGTYITPQLQRYGGLYGGPSGIIHQLLAR